MISRMRVFIRTFTADTIALLIYGTFVSASALLLEVFIFVIPWEQFGMMRFVYNLVKYSSASIPAKITELLSKKFPRASGNKFLEALIDWIALSLHQIPIYATIAIAFGINFRTVLLISTIYLVENLLFGWLYGILLKWLREKFKAKTAY